MWPFKKKTIRETKKVSLYGRQSRNASNYSVWGSMSIIEKFIMVMGPIALTYIDYMITDSIFGLPKWLTAIIAIGSTILLFTLLTLFITWLTERGS